MADLMKIGLVGLGVMGENLALNIERNGFSIAVFNRTTSKVDAFVNGPAKGKRVLGCHDVADFCKSLERPRRIILLVKAGDAVDQTIAELVPHLEAGDIVIDAGNSHFMDTRRREQALREKGLYMIGSGVSGGEEGALWGPSLMPGGDRAAYEQIRPIWEAIAARVDDGPCVTYLGPDGAGHFVKMVHNGIEYGDMQLIAETYDILRRGLGLEPQRISEIFTEWNKGLLDSYLIEITAKILTVIDDETKKPLVDLILDKAGQKGTGKWTAEIAQELAVPIPTIDAALTARLVSALKDQRVAASKKLDGSGRSLAPPARTDRAEPAEPDQKGENARYDGDPQKLIDALADALYASKICSYAQGMALIRAGSDSYGWNINLAECARIWKGGCIIRAKLLDRISQAFRRSESLPNLLIDEDFASWIVQAQPRWREAVAAGVRLGIPTLALGISLSYFDSYRTAVLPQNLTQAQRDFFGAHTYERVDKPELGFVHTDWDGLEKAEARA